MDKCIIDKQMKIIKEYSKNTKLLKIFIEFLLKNKIIKNVKTQNIYYKIQISNIQYLTCIPSIDLS